jgi:hypothetical protein
MSSRTTRRRTAAHREYAALTGFDPDNYTAIVNKLMPASSDLTLTKTVRSGAKKVKSGEREGGQWWLVACLIS